MKALEGLMEIIKAKTGSWGLQAPGLASLGLAPCHGTKDRDKGGYTRMSNECET